PSRRVTRPYGGASQIKGAATRPTMHPSPISTSSTPRVALLSDARSLSEDLAPLSEPLACLLAPGAGAGAIAAPAAVAALGARTLLDLPTSERTAECGRA